MPWWVVSASIMASQISAAAVIVARQGARVELVQDRPVLGGNVSKEICVPPVGVMNCNFAYSRETGIIEELYLNNFKHNRPGAGKVGT